MKRLIGMMLAGVLLLGAAAVYAADGCCAAGKAKAAATGSACSDAFAKLNLTADQKVKVAALQTDCSKVGCPVTAKAKCEKGLKEILSADQFKQWQAETSKVQKDPSKS